MLILSKGKDTVINMDSLSNVFVKDTDVIARWANGPGLTVGHYETFEDAKMALREIADTAFRHEDICILPSDKQVQARRINEYTDKTGIHHYANGQKTKGHGGS